MTDPVTWFTYLSLALGGFIEGPAISTFSGYLSRLGYLNLPLVVAVFVLADILSDLFYFSLGRLSLRHASVQAFFQKKLSYKREVIADLWERHFLSMMFFGKLAYGISVAVVMSAGALNMPLRKFLAYSIPVSLLQTSALVLIGYLLGEAYTEAARYVEYPLLVASIVLSVAFALIYYLKARTKKFLLK
jgi:membrane-associated protein